MTTSNEQLSTLINELAAAGYTVPEHCNVADIVDLHRIHVLEAKPIEPVVETPVEQVEEEVPMEEQPKQEQQAETLTVEQFKERLPKWLVSAIDTLCICSKQAFIGHVIVEFYKPENKDNKEAIDNMIKRLQQDDAYWNTKVKGFIAFIKGWQVDEAGRVADALYTAANYTGKGAFITMDKLGDGLIWLGEKAKDVAPTVSKVAAAPLNIMGDAAYKLGSKQTTKGGEKDERKS